MELANSIITLQPGMYILRHPKTGLPPISISRAAGKPAHNGRIEALYTPNTDGGILRDGRDCIVMQVLNAPVDLLVTAYLDKPGATVPALRVDKIALEASGPSTASAQSHEIPPKGITLIGHIEKRGDVMAIDGRPLGDPDSELRLEGFQIMWPDKPDGVELNYMARIEGAGETPLMSTGRFCGTRMSSKRLVGLTLNLTGPRASMYALKGNASFSGGFSCELHPGLSITGPSGLEHLTALQVDVSAISAERPSAGAWQPSAKTKIFKAAKSSGRSVRKS